MAFSTRGNPVEGTQWMIASTTSRAVSPTFSPALMWSSSCDPGCERGDRDELSLPQIEDWALINLAEREFHHVSTDVGRDVFEALDAAFARLGVNLHETLPSALEALAWLFGHRYSLQLWS
jgi:hypothetical protein